MRIGTTEWFLPPTHPKKPHLIWLSEKGGSSPLVALSPAEFEELTGVCYTARVVIPTVGLLHQAERIDHRAFQRGYFDSTRKWLAAYHREMLEENHPPPLYIKWLGSSVGYGVFARVALPPHHPIGCYTGILLRRDLLSLHVSDYSFRYPTERVSLCPLMVDAEWMGNETRFINHSDHPNLETIGLPAHPIAQILLRTRCAISAHTQLTLDYGARYWRTAVHRKIPF